LYHGNLQSICFILFAGDGSQFSSTCPGCGLGMLSCYVRFSVISRSFPVYTLSPNMTYLRIFNIRVTRRVSLLEQELLTIPEYLGFPSVSSVRHARIVQLLSLHVFSSVLWCPIRFPRKTTFGLSSLSVSSGVSV
jgi:hypothetical protein